MILFFRGVDEIAYEMGQDFENEMIWGDFFIAHFKGCRFMFQHAASIKSIAHLKTG